MTFNSRSVNAGRLFFFMGSGERMVSSQHDWPDWWRWELDCTNPHLAKRMLDRQFSETDLREMLADAETYRPDALPGRWIIQTRRKSEPWEVVVEPDESAELLVIVTAYRTSGGAT